MMDDNVTGLMGEGEREELTVPVPPRYWWLKRIFLACALLLVLLVGLRLWWGYVVHQRLQTEIDRLVAAGEPIFPEDFDTPPVPDPENAALLYTNAANAFVKPAEATIDISLFPTSSFTPAQLAEAQLYVDANTNALRLARQARDLPKVDWGLHIRRPAITFSLPAFTQQRQLARLLAVAARHHHHLGHDAETIATVRDLLALGDAVNHWPLLISHFVAISIDALAANSVEHVAPTLAVGGAHDTFDPDPEPAKRAEVTALIAELLDEQRSREAFIRAMQCERMVYLDSIESVIRGNLGLTSLTVPGGSGLAAAWARILTWPIKPLFELDGIASLRFGTAWVEAVQEPTWPALLSRRPLDPGTDEGLLERVKHPLSSILLPSLHRATLLHYRSLADRRMAAVALAIRLHEIDHGRCPRQLTDLVPEFLDHVPLDPFSAEERVIGYRPDAALPLLYSVSTNGVDDGGTFAFRRKGGIDWEVLDLPFFLDGNRPEFPRDLPTRPVASQQAGDDQDNVEDDGGEADEDESGQPQPQERQSEPQ
ncbi:MAG: hypothetical protein V2A79_12425 [Planctomycetota bacterium]